MTSELTKQSADEPGTAVSVPASVAPSSVAPSLVALSDSKKEGDELLKQGTTIAFEQQQKSTVMKVISPLGRRLTQRRWYHGYMTKQEAGLLCHENGEWLVRRAHAHGTGEVYCITVRFKDQIHHIPLVQTQHLKYFVLQNIYCKEATTLVQYCYEYGVPLTEAGIVLGNYVSRQDWSIRAEQLRFGKKLGSGAFGDVVEGELRVWSGTYKVAIKRMKDDKHLAEDTKLILLREAANMQGLNHPHILKLYGVHVINEPLMIVMELAPDGNVLEKVKNTTNPPTMADKERYVWEIVDGMQYLESKCIIHKDLAARNCLLSNNLIKISDFGLSCVCVDNKGQKVTKNGKVPTRWRAPESLSIPAFYSNKSDVWSFGAVIFEIYSNGQKPYHQIKRNHDIRVGIRSHKLVLEVADGTPEYIGTIQRRCMNFDKDSRPDFAELWGEIQQHLPRKHGFHFWNLFRRRGPPRAAEKTVSVKTARENSEVRPLLEA